MIDDLQISHLSTEYVKVPITATVNGITYNPTNDTVKMAFTAVGSSPADSDLKNASWETVGSKHYARCLVGPQGGQITLTAGQYWVWVKISDNPETPVLLCGQVEVI